MVMWFVERPVATALVLLLLMSLDWLLTVLTERARRLRYSGHNFTYPIDTMEGSPFLRAAVAKQRIVNAKHIIPALVLSAIVGYSLTLMPRDLRPAAIGYFWGLFLIVGSTHLGNLAGFRLGSRGIHGAVWIHLRTAYAIQMGRYAGLAFLLTLVALLSASAFTAGVAVAAITSTLRQLLWMSRSPKIGVDDKPPVDSIQGFGSPSGAVESQRRHDVTSTGE